MSEITRQNNRINFKPVLPSNLPTVDAIPTKSELKRRMDRLQDLGKKLVNLPAGKLARIELPEELHAAVVEARRISAMGALRRQIQYIGRIIEEFDTVAIARALRDVDSEKTNKIVKNRQRQASDAILAAEELLEKGQNFLFETYSQSFEPEKLQRLRQALRTAVKNIESGKDRYQEVENLAGLFELSH